MAKLNANQIQDLYTFTRQHFVVYYDLQTELVDHLANDIEAMWETQPQLSFEDAKLKAFKKFGIFGFMKPIEDKEKAMSKRYRRYLWKEFKHCFKMPQLLTTLLIFSTYYVSILLNAWYFYIALYLGVVIWSFIKGRQVNKIYKARKKASNKTWLMEDLIFQQAQGVQFTFFSNMYTLMYFTDISISSPYKAMGLALLYTVLSFLSYISLHVLPNKAEKLLQNTYPEYKLV